MFGRLAMVAAMVALSACAGIESAGRTASRAPQPAPVSRPAPQPAPPAAALPPPQQAAPAPTVSAPQASPALTVPPASVAAPIPEPQPTQAPPVAAPEVRVPTPTAAPPRPRSDDDDIVVPGQAQEQVIAPRGDFRSREQRNEDIRAWDQCVSAVQAVYERDPMRPQLDSPEDYCARSLGMANRDAIPESRLQRVRR
ncbi:hypothetical protein [Vitreimonas sp.]|jgi:hypothetical protein|uniref:hypothetical protein n=1 Tax=Vitreimonas sp. TaxID=3069702 RepID=UPI002EDA5DC2